MATAPTITDFFKQFPDDNACLDYLMQLRHGNPLDCPKCGKHGKFHRIRRHPAYECAWCGYEIYPMVGTMFHRSHVPLQKWFYAMYLFTTTRHGVPAKELQRQLGVSYPTAFRMAHKIRDYMGLIDGDDSLGGHVEADETFVGGRRKRERGGWTSGRGTPRKIVVLGMVERDGEVMTRIVPNASSKSLIPHIVENVRRGSTISTDEWRPYRQLAKHGFRHLRVKHSDNEWVRGEAHTNTLEGFWSQLKRSICRTHVHVSKKYLPKYRGEFEYRYNLRKRPGQMFARLLTSL